MPHPLVVKRLCLNFGVLGSHTTHSLYPPLSPLYKKFPNTPPLNTSTEFLQVRASYSFSLNKMSFGCGNCDCADKSQCTKNRNNFGVEIVETNNISFESKMEENDCKCDGCSCHNA